MHKDDIATLGKAKYNASLCKFEDVTRKSKQTLSEFIYDLLTKHNQHKQTVVVDTGKVCCSIKRLRSLGDIFLLCSYYYPGVRLKTVKDALLAFGDNLVGHHCGTIKRRVYTHKHTKPRFVQSGKGIKDEFGDCITYNTIDESIYK